MNLSKLEAKNPLLAFHLKGKKKRLKNYEPLFFKVGYNELIFIKNLQSVHLDLSAIANDLKEKKSILIIVDQISALRSDLLSEEILHLLTSSLIFWHLEEEISDELFLKWAWTFPFKTIKSYSSFSWIKQFQDCYFSVYLIFSEYRDYGLHTFKNLFENQVSLSKSFATKIIKGSKVALLCGAGPSLEKSLSILKNLEGMCTLFAGGHAIKILDAHHIKIDCAFAIDPSFYLEKPLFQAPHLVYSLRAHPQMVATRWDQKALIPPAGESLIEQELWKELFGIEPIFDSGWNVGNVMAAWAEKMGFNQIILCGMDMTLSEKKKYPFENCGYENTLSLIELLDQGEVKVTTRDFYLGRDFFEKLIKDSSASWYRVDSGLSIDGVSKIDLETFPFNREEKKIRFSLQAEQKKVELFFTKFKNSCYESLGLLEKILTIGNPSRFALEEVLLEEEMFYKLVLKRNWEIWGLYLSQSYVENLDLMRFVFFQKVTKDYHEYLYNIRGS